MKNFVASVVALIVGFFTLTLAAVMGLFVSIAALIARPFIKKKMTAAYEEAVRQQGQPFSQSMNGTVIDGEYDDITDRVKQPHSRQFCNASN
ncbi:hypothetical protein [Photobacterium sp. J15]|uniref:hypothetical protein n=1 Tax=Photobacterium sp. J15 TaxID=265901 RepID=UPI0007E4A134|nr:hypothetical protein [Photobacterium sp. J15]